MAILKKLSASSLLETLIASVLIILVFIISTTLLTNIAINEIKRDNLELESRLIELQYLATHGLIEVPYYETNEDWHIELINEGGRYIGDYEDLRWNNLSHEIFSR